MPCAKLKLKPLLLASSLLLISGSLLAGCGQTVLYQPADQPVRLAEPVQARVWVRDQSGQWVKSANRVTLPEGFDVLPPPAIDVSPSTTRPSTPSFEK